MANKKEGNEKRFTRDFVKIIEKYLKRCNVEVGIEKDLLYRVVVDERHKFPIDENKLSNLKQIQNYSFKKDILVMEKDTNLPLVAIEVKLNYNTHEVITYSTKAIRHKLIYPYLRYGFLVAGEDRLHDRFFNHADGFDFGYAIKDVNLDDREEIKGFVKIIRDQIKVSRDLREIFFNNKKANIKCFSFVLEKNKC